MTDEIDLQPRPAGELEGGLHEVEMGGTDNQTGDTYTGMAGGILQDIKQAVDRIEQAVSRNTPGLSYLQSTTLTTRSPYACS